MKKISYSKDVDALLIEISNDSIAYAEEDGQVILHYSPDDKLVLVEILDFRRFMSKESVAAMLAAWASLIATQKNQPNTDRLSHQHNQRSPL